MQVATWNIALRKYCATLRFLQFFIIKLMMSLLYFALYFCIVIVLCYSFVYFVKTSVLIFLARKIVRVILYYTFFFIF